MPAFWDVSLAMSAVRCMKRCVAQQFPWAGTDFHEVDVRHVGARVGHRFVSSHEQFQRCCLALVGTSGAAGRLVARP